MWIPLFGAFNKTLVCMKLDRDYIAHCASKLFLLLSPSLTHSLTLLLKFNICIRHVFSFLIHAEESMSCSLTSKWILHFFIVWEKSFLIHRIIKAPHGCWCCTVIEAVLSLHESCIYATHMYVCMHFDYDAFHF